MPPKRPAAKAERKPRKRPEKPRPAERSSRAGAEQVRRGRPPPQEGAQPARRAEVLEAALELISEHGVAGASLRMLARKLGMSQPSLYHYFPSKDALVAEILDYSTGRMLGVGGTLEFPKTVAELPGFVKRAVLALYATESHPRFVRFLFLVALGNPEHRAAVRRVFEERLNPSFGMLVAGFGSNDAERAELREVLRMVVYSLGFMLLDERALMGKPTASADTLRYADWVEHAATTLLVARGLVPSAL